MNRLAELLPFNAGETVASHCSRLAAASGYERAYSFGTDHGFRFFSLAVGNQKAIEAYADVLQVHASDLTPGVMKPSGNFLLIGGEQEIEMSMLERSRLRYCPRCLEDDERFGEGRRGHRAFGRLTWQIKSVRSCRRHGIRLFTSPLRPDPMFLHDFAAELQAELVRTKSAPPAAEKMKTDNLQLYTEARLAGDKTMSPWLDTFPLYVALKICETIGACERHGIDFRAAALDEREWSTCAGMGFDLVHGGPASLEESLRSQMVRFQDAYPRSLGRSGLGSLYRQLTFHSLEQEYRPIREIIRNVGLETLPLAPGDYFLGPVTERRVHSVSSAAQQFKVNTRMLLNQLINAGAVPVSARSTTPERVLLDAKLMESHARELKRKLNVRSASAYLGIDETSFRALVKHGHIISASSMGSLDTARLDWTFDQRVLDEVVAKVASAASCSHTNGLCSIQEAARAGATNLVVVIEKILDGAIKTVGIDTNENGFGRIKVDPNEVKRCTAVQPHGCYTFAEVSRLIPIDGRVVSALVAEGRLPTVQRPVLRRGSNHTVIEPEALHEFTRQYVALPRLSEDAGIARPTLMGKLDHAGVAPAFIAAGTRFYRRSDVDPVRFR